MSLDLTTLAAIVAMMVATVFTRLAGSLLVRRLDLGDKALKALGVVPPAVLMAVVTPTALATGWAETVACAVTAVAALRLPLLPAATAGVLTVALLRWLGV